MHQIAGCLDQPANLVLTENGWQPALSFRKRYMVRQVWPSQGLNEEEPQRSAALLDGAGGQFTVAK
jgi:hypothetical protein